MTQEELHAQKREFYRWAKTELRGMTIINEPTGNAIEISSQGIDEWYSKSKTEEQVKSILKLPDILRNAKFSHSAKNTHSERKNAPSFEYYECPVLINDKGFNAVVSVKLVVVNDGKRRIYYHHYLDDEKKSTALNSSAPT